MGWFLWGGLIFVRWVHLCGGGINNYKNHTVKWCKISLYFRTCLIPYRTMKLSWWSRNLMISLLVSLIFSSSRSEPSWAKITKKLPNLMPQTKGWALLINKTHHLPRYWLNNSSNKNSPSRAPLFLSSAQTSPKTTMNVRRRQSCSRTWKELARRLSKMQISTANLWGKTVLKNWKKQLMRL